MIISFVVDFKTNVINGFKKIVSLLWPVGINIVNSQDFDGQKRLVLAVSNFTHNFCFSSILCFILFYPELINHSRVTRS